ncbi:MAG: T9SS type A sorting domain-containing protein [Bacteroidetes bacterium]|nr:T9SS type A sorting domain-containing protein [Bacteroidota bacterium]
METDEGVNYCDSYLLIDDVTIVQGCDEPCSRTAGCFDYKTNNTHWAHCETCTTCAPNKYLKFWNLENATDAVVNISLMGQHVATFSVQNAVNGITEPMYWNGKDAQGNEFGPNTYAYSLTVWNDCNPVTGPGVFFSGTFVKSHFGNCGSVNPPVYTYDNDIKIPKPCCKNSMLLENELITGPSYKDFVAGQFITTNNSVILEPNTNVLFRAGEEIVLNDGFEAQSGSKFDCFLDQCSNPMSMMTIFDDYSSIIHDENSSFDLMEETDTLFFLTNLPETPEEYFKFYPNPSTGQVNIEWNINGENMNKGEISVRNILGNIVFAMEGFNTKNSEIIDLSALPKGVYYIHAVFGEKVFVKNLILQ